MGPKHYDASPRYLLNRYSTALNDSHLGVDVVELREPDQVGADQDPELHALAFPPLSLAAVALVLHPDPQLVHLGEVQEDVVDRVLNLEPI